MIGRTNVLPSNPIPWHGAPQDFTGDNNLGIYTSETTQRYVYGTRYITWDGRVYKYTGVTTGGCKSHVAVSNDSAAITDWVASTVAAAGDIEFVVTDTSIAQDRLAGAMLVLYKATIANSTRHWIVGNDKDNGTNVRCYLEFPLPAAATISDSIEIFENPYRAVEQHLTGGLEQFGAWIGVPCTTAATGYNVWTQTWGPTLIGPGNTTLDDAAANERMVVFVESGTLHEVNVAGVTAGYQQFAGYILNNGTAGIAGPQIYLMCST